MAKSLCIFFLLVAILSTVQCTLSNSPAPSPGPSFPACMLVDLSPLMDCINYVQVGSNVTEPDAGCCKSYVEILKNDESVACLCDGLKHPGDSPIPMNLTRMDSLPSLCNSQAPSCTNAPSPSPVPSPPPSSDTPSPPSVPTPVPSTPETPTPAGSGSSGASSLSISAAFLAAIAASVAALF
ncbi:non-specific lipid transfer protein GPI-anchored 4-like [Aristolochia californica]|uniref:non-specific lipid transfer protein GPI-anchored 4-like n=1 Tax=Aristolochia californica TaxID=171875 RepID=UPI0035E1E1FE